MDCVQGGSKLERARDLFEQCLDGCPAKFAKGTPLSVPVVLCLSVPVVLFYLYLVEAVYLKAYRVYSYVIALFTFVCVCV